MTKEQIRTKFDRWAERVGHTPFENGLDNATLLLSYDDKQTSTTLSTVAVYAVAVHTDHVHVFLFSVQIVWQLDAQDDTGKVLDEVQGYCGVLARVVKKVVGSISFLKKNGLFAPIYNFNLKFTVFLL